MSLVGRQIGRYKILEQVGQGGMSVVYKGLDTALEREVAVKVLHPHLANKAESRKRLEREAKAVARLHHPNILEVFDYAGADAHDAFIVCEYIRGHTLRTFINDEPLQPPEIAAMVVHELASALAHAHDVGVLHRDLKPENVMVREDGVLKLMDFGIAKILDRDEKMTMTGALVGSPAHMAPEIIEGEEAGPEADVFSLGTMLYLFATGKLPFTAPNTTATLKRILDCVYDDPRQVVPTVSDELAEIIGTCLRRSPSARYPSAGKLRDALAALLGELGLSRPHEELPKFFVEPRAYRRDLVPRVTQALLARAEKLIQEKKPARAMSALNQVLAHEPSNARASELLAQMKARKLREQRAKKLTRAAVLLGGVFVVALGTWRGVSLAMRPPDYRLAAPLAPTDVALAAVAWPKPPKPAPLDPPIEPPVDPPRLPVKDPKGTVTARVDPRLLEPKAAAPVEVVVTMRPFAYLAVDKGPRSVDALNRHVVKLPPGPHTLLGTCDVCETAGTSVTVEVKPNMEPVLLKVPLKASLVRFDGFPPDAMVRVGAEERTVADTAERPFRIVSPATGSTELRHKVRYEVVHQGKVLAHGEQAVTPGQPAVVDGRGP